FAFLSYLARRPGHVACRRQGSIFSPYLDLRGSLMRFFFALGLFPLLLGCAPSGGFSHGAQALAADGAAGAPAGLGARQAQPGPARRAGGHVALAAPAVLHPVTEVLVQVGEHVKKGQALVKLDADEPEADLRGKQAALKEVRANLARLQAEPRQHELQEAEAT